MPHPFSRLQLRHFRLIDAIALNGQLSLAADACAMTQPAASRSLAEIETLIGTQLFLRHPKGMSPTPTGEVLARHAAILLSGLDQASDELTAFRDGRAGVVRVGAVTGAAVRYVVPAIRALKTEADGADVRVEVAPSVDLMDDLLAGELDFVLCRVPAGTDPGRLEVLRGRVEHVAFLVGTGHPLLARDGLTIADLTDCTWVMQSRGMPIREAMVQRHLMKGLEPPQDVIQTSSLLLTIAYLQASHAVSPVAQEVSDLLRGTAAGGIETLRMGEQITLSPYHLIRRKDRPINPLAQRLLDIVLRDMTT